MATNPIDDITARIESLQSQIAEKRQQSPEVLEQELSRLEQTKLELEAMQLQVESEKQIAALQAKQSKLAKKLRPHLDEFVEQYRSLTATFEETIAPLLEEDSAITSQLNILLSGRQPPVRVYRRVVALPSLEISIDAMNGALLCLRDASISPPPSPPGVGVTPSSSTDSSSQFRPPIMSVEPAKASQVPLWKHPSLPLKDSELFYQPKPGSQPDEPQG